MITPELINLDIDCFPREDADGELRSAESFRATATLNIDVGESPMGLFNMIICAPTAMTGCSRNSGPIAWYLFCSRFSAKVIRREIDRRINWCMGRTEDDALAKLCLWFAWEGNRYRPADAPDVKENQLPWHQRSVASYWRQAHRDIQRLQRERPADSVICLGIDPATTRLVELT